VCHENPSSPRELSGYFDVRQVLGQSGPPARRKRLDNNAPNDWEILRIICDRYPDFTFEG
jgi:hypothetical protein